MVLLTMTPSMVQALLKIQALEENEDLVDERRVPFVTAKNNQKLNIAQEHASQNAAAESKVTSHYGDEAARLQTREEPTLQNPQVGNPISHGQAVDLSRKLKAQNIAPHTLDGLLRGARVYIAPPPPKAERTPQYKALMARLRREEEERSYIRMTNPPPPMETFRQRFPASSAAHAFDSNHYPTAHSDPFAEKDDVEFADVDRQLGLVLNVLVSIFACAGAIWVTAKWWSTPARLALSLGGSILVGVAEVVIYSGYVRRIGESKGKEKGVKEIKEVIKTWVIGRDDVDKFEGSKTVTISPKTEPNETGARKRNIMST